MRIAICDDEIYFAKDLEHSIEMFFQSLDLVIDIFTDSEELLNKLLKKEVVYEAVFLDIEMPHMNGMTLAKKIREQSEKMEIIFLTSHTEFMADGYEVMAFRFLTKPLQKEKLERTLQALEKKHSSIHKIEIVEDGIHYFIPQMEILCIKADNVYVKMHTEDREFLIRDKLSNIKQKLDKDIFFEVHRSFIISLSAVSSYQKKRVVLKNNMEIPVSRNRQGAFEDAMLNYMRKQS